MSVADHTTRHSNQTRAAKSLGYTPDQSQDD